MNTRVLQNLFKELKLNVCGQEVSNVLSNCNCRVETDWLVDLLTKEVDSRREKKLANRIRQANFKGPRSIEEFDFDFNPKINRRNIEELANLDFIKEKRVVLFVGEPGTGKTHLAEAIGLKAIMKNYRVYCSSTKRLVEDILRYMQKNDLPSLFKKILSVDLFILDDWGTVALNQKVSEEVFDLLDRRIRNVAMILTSNRLIEEWPEIFADKLLASATIDRMFEDTIVEQFRGASYRLNGGEYRRKKAISN